jgi:restriction system protein
VVKLQDLSGIDFEKLISTLLIKMGFQTEMTKTTGDGGIDIIAMLDKPIFGGRYLFQCKRFAPDNLVGSPTVRDFYGAVTADRAVKGILITTSDFTVQAQEFGQKVGVELVSMNQLRRLLVEYGLAENLDE